MNLAKDTDIKKVNTMFKLVNNHTTLETFTLIISPKVTVKQLFKEIYKLRCKPQTINKIKIGKHYTKENELNEPILLDYLNM